jgi:uncharacterized repeat protein (TIGR01451 family)
MNRKAFVNLVLIAGMAFVFVFSPQSSVNARTGGPETSGYVFVDSDEAGGPAYNLEDISSTGTKLSLTADNGVSGPIAIGFPFRFFGVDYNNVYINTDGYVSFLAQSDSPNPVAIPSSGAPNAIIAGWWGDLKPAYGGGYYYQLMGSAPNRYFLIQYKDIPYGILDNVLGNKVSFEIKLFETTHVIEVHYAAPALNNVSSSNLPNTAGIENETGLIGLQYYYGLDGIASSLAVRYTPFVGVALEPDSFIGYGYAGETKTYEMNVYNWTGQADTFSLATSGSHWPTVLSADTTGVLAQGQGFAFTLQVTFPSDAVAANYDAVDVAVTSGLNNPDTAQPWTDTTHIITAVPRMGYVFNQNEIDFVDTQFHQVVRAPVDATPYGVFLQTGAMSPDGKYVYGLMGGGQDENGGVLIGEVGIWDVNNMDAAPYLIEVGNDASNIVLTADGKYALVTSYGDGTLKVIDTDPASATYRTVIKTITVGKQAIRIAASACLNKAYITNKQDNTVSVINLSTLAVDATLTGFSTPWGIVVAPSGDRVYVSNNGNGRITPIDSVNDTVLTAWNVGGSSLQDIDITPDGSRLYTPGSANTLVVNTSTGTLNTSIPNEASGLYGVSVLPATIGPMAYTANGGSQTISVINTNSNTITATISVPGAPSGLALYPPATGCNLAPIAAFGPKTLTGQVGVPFTFIDRSIRNPTSWTWNFGDGETSTEANPTHTYTGSGPYTVTLTTSNAYGSSNTASRVINFMPKASFTTNPSPAWIQVGQSVVFTSTSTGTANLTYAWDFGDKTTGSGVTATHTYTTVGDYTVKLTVTNSFGSDSATAKVDFPAIAAFTTSAGLPVIIQNGDTVTFTNNSTGTAPLSYSWNFGDGSAADTSQSPQHVYTGPGPYTATLTASNAYGSASTASILVHFKPTASFTPVQSKLTQANHTVTFTNASVGDPDLSYAWAFGDGATSTDASPSHAYSNGGPYTVTLTVTNPYGNHSTTGSVVFLPEASFTTDHGGTSPLIHSGDTVKFTNTSTGTATLVYAWTFGDGGTSSEASPSHTFTGNGPYTVTLKVTNSYDTVGTTASVTVNVAPTASFTTDHGGTTPQIHSGDTVKFTNTSTGTATMVYAWTFGDGGTSSEASPSHTFTGNGPFTVSLKVTNAFDSSGSTASLTVNVLTTASFTADHGGPTPKIHSGDMVNFTNSSTGSGTLTYAWTFGDGGTSALASPSHTFSGSGPFTVTLKVTSAVDSTGSTATMTVNVMPTASFTTDHGTQPQIHSGDSITFTDTSIGTAPLVYAWTFGDGGTSTLASPSHTFTGNGPFTVSLKVTNAADSTGSTASVTVNVLPTASFTTDHGGTTPRIHSGDTVVFTSTSTGTGALTYAWTFGDSGTSTLANPSHTFSGNGPFTVSLKVTSALDSTGSTASLTVNVLPTASFTTDHGTQPQIHSGDAIVFTNTSSGTATMAYAWTFGDGGTSTLASPSHTFTGNGPFTVTLKVTNPFDSTGSTASVVVNVKPTASFTTDHGGTTPVIHSGDNVAFTNTSTGTGTLTYAWTFGDGGTSTLASPSHTFTGNGPFTVSLKVTNAIDSTGSTASVTVNVAPRASFTTNPSPAWIQIGQTVTFTSTSTATASHLTYTWDFGDQTSGSGATASHAYPIVGDYTVRLTVSNDYGSDSVTAKVDFVPSASFSSVPGEPIIIRAGDSVAFTNTSTGTAPLTYTWNFGDQSSAVHDANPTHQYAHAGIYTVTLQVSNGYGSPSTATTTVRFRPTAEFVTNPNPAIVEVGQAVAFTNLSTGSQPLQYLWDFGDGTTSTAENPSHAYQQRKPFTVTLTVHNGIGSDATATQLIQVDPIPTDLAATVTDDKEKVDVGESITYTIVISNMGQSDAPGALVHDTLSPWLEDVTWTCIPSQGSNCTSSGSGNSLDDVVTVMAGGNVTYTVTARVKWGAAGIMENEVTVSLLETYVDTQPADNSAKDQTLVWGKTFLPLLSK